MQGEKQRLAWVRKLADAGDPRDIRGVVITREHAGRAQALATDGHRAHMAYVRDSYPYIEEHSFLAETLKKGFPIQAENVPIWESPKELCERITHLFDESAARTKILDLSISRKGLVNTLKKRGYAYPKKGFSAKITVDGESGAVYLTGLTQNVFVWVKDKKLGNKTGAHKGQRQSWRTLDKMEGAMPVIIEDCHRRVPCETVSFWVDPRYLIDALPTDGILITTGDLEPLHIFNNWGEAIVMPMRKPDVYTKPVEASRG